MSLSVVITIPSRVWVALCCLLLFFSRWYMSRNFLDCVYRFLQCLILYYDFPVLQFFDLSFSFNVFCDSFFIDSPYFCFIGSLPPSNSLFIKWQWVEYIVFRNEVELLESFLRRSILKSLNNTKAKILLWLIVERIFWILSKKTLQSADGGLQIVPISVVLSPVFGRG